MNPLISVVIPTYNYRKYVVEAVESVLAQTYQPLEVIVADDGSTDGTGGELARYGDRIRYLHQENRGVPAARKPGIRAATGEYVAFLDSDDLWAPTKIERQVAVMEKNPEVGAVFCETQSLNLASGETFHGPCRADVRGDIRRKLLHKNCVTGSASAVLVRRECIDKVGLFDEALRSAEDWDLWIRISREYHFDYVSEPLVILRNHGGNMHKKIATMHEAQMQVVERAFREDPVDGGNLLLRHRSLAYVHFDAGDEYYMAGDFRSALRHLVRSAALWPFNVRHHTYLARALVRGVAPRKSE
jgi:glycosyltransferase involved in cell wall biosynthesis